jgi:hypothetical protein
MKTEGSAARGVVGSLLHLLTNHLTRWVFAVWFGIGLIHLILGQLPLILLHESVGYGDSYILLTILDFGRTGILYPPVGPNHLTPVLYSPLLYLMHFAAWSVVPSADNPYLGPRLLELFWFLACVFLAGALTRRLLPVRSAFALGALVAATYSVATPWVLQLRADFPGITCSLLALWFLLSRRRGNVILAGVCAGLALQFKITFVAASVAGFAWLFLYRRWRALAEFTVAVVVSSVGFYAAYSWHEPEMLRQILMMKKMIPHVAGLLVFFRQLGEEPSVLLAVAGLLPMLGFILTQRRPRLQLFTIFLVVSFAAGAYASIQAGGSINYFYEAIFAATPFAVLALLRLRSERSRTSGLLVAFLLLTVAVLPGAARTLWATRVTLTGIGQRNQTYESLRAALDGTRIASSIPDVTILRPEPAITEPYLLSYLSITRGADLSSFIARIDQGYFDVIVTAPADYSWRTIPQLERSVRAAIIRSYIPYCLLNDKLFHVPKNLPLPPVAGKLRSIGCEVVQCGPGSKCPGLGAAIEAFR